MSRIATYKYFKANQLQIALNKCLQNFGQIVFESHLNKTVCSLRDPIGIEKKLFTTVFAADDILQVILTQKIKFKVIRSISLGLTHIRDYEIQMLN